MIPTKQTKIWILRETNQPDRVFPIESVALRAYQDPLRNSERILIEAEVVREKIQHRTEEEE